MNHLKIHKQSTFKWFVFLWLLLLNFNLLCQNYADKDYYLIDSLNLNELNESDRILIDTCIVNYHAVHEDTTKLAIIEFIVDECWDENIWPKYNEIVFQQALFHLNKSNNKVEQQKFASLLAGAISNKGYLYDNLANIPLALKNYHLALSIYERIGDYQGASSSFNNLGVLYSAQGDTAQALFYHNESLRIKKQLNDLQGISMSLNNLGTIYKNKGRIFEALDCFERSLKICNELNDLRGTAICYDNIGGIYFSEGYPSKAIDYYTKAYEIRLKNSEYSGVAFSLNNIARVYLKLGNYNTALNYAEQSMQYAQLNGFPIDIINASESLFQLYKIKNDHKQALSYYELYSQMKDSLYNMSNEKAILAQSLKYEFEKQLLKDSLKNQKLQLQKDLQIIERDTIIKQEKYTRYALVAALLLMVYIVYISYKNYKRKQKANELIQQQKEEVEEQKLKIEKQHTILEQTYKELADSISYAKRIQQAILPSKELIDEIISDYFIWYLPKDVVSGDFYWLQKIENKTIIAVADCTGHGVPGAMVSVICHNALNRAVKEFKKTKPDEILNTTRELVIESLSKNNNDVKDGMDISLICIENNKLQFAGANNNFYLFRKGKSEIGIAKIENTYFEEFDLSLLEFKPDKQPIGKYALTENYNCVELELQKNDLLYLFTDGFADQFGGVGILNNALNLAGKKFKYKQIKNTLSKINNLPLKEQHEFINQVYINWKGDLEQVDDVCMFGIKI